MKCVGKHISSSASLLHRLCALRASLFTDYTFCAMLFVNEPYIQVYILLESVHVHVHFHWSLCTFFFNCGCTKLYSTLQCALTIHIVASGLHKAKFFSL